MDYPNQQLLVTAEWLSACLHDSSVVVLDTRVGKAPLAYREGHIRGARPFSLPHALGVVAGTPECLLEEAMAQQLGELGVRPEQTVVLYDDALSTALMQSFWAFERLGQREVRVLAGGFEAWQAQQGEVSQRPTEYQRCFYDATPRECLATSTWIEAREGDPRLVDARGPQEWRAAHIAGATNCCWSDFTQGDEACTLRPASEIQALLEARTLSPEQETVTYCRSGARSSFVYFVLRLMGWERLRNYDGSMTDWLLHERAVTRG
jgi:thiosulfate/3-mercaptopyruvate sulfurtransferase